jgi:hypothetical protein
MTQLAANVIDLFFILNGNAFLVPVKLRKNDEIININALMDTGA